MISRSIRTPLCFFASFALGGCLAFAQSAPSPQEPAPPYPTSAAPIERHPPSGPEANGPMRHGMIQDSRHASFRGGMMHNNRFHGGPESTMDGALHIAPPGMWWKSPMIVQRLSLTPEQVKRMDAIFQESRLQLIDLKANLDKQQVLLEPMLRANPLETARAMAQIDKVAQARADLEKADARMLLGIRAVLTPEQWTRLNDRHRSERFGVPAAAANSPDPQAAPAPPARP